MRSLRLAGRAEAYRLGGVDASVNLATESARVRYDAELVRLEELLGAVEAAGYRAQPALGLRERSVGRPWRLLVAAVLSVPLVALMLPGASVRRLGVARLRHSGRPSSSGPAGRFTVRSFLNARHRAATMDTLVLDRDTCRVGVVGRRAGWSGVGRDVLQVGAVITTLILARAVARVERAPRASGAAIRALLELGAREARVVR